MKFPSPKFRNILWFFIILLTASTLTLFFMKSSSWKSVCFKDKCLRVELAVAEKARERGLMGRHYLGEDRGMLFVFSQESFWPFWMKNTYIPLDIIWIDESGKVVDMVRDAKPAGEEGAPVTFVPVLRAKFALEANAGFADKNHIHIGDQAKFK